MCIDIDPKEFDPTESVLIQAMFEAWDELASGQPRHDRSGTA